MQGDGGDSYAFQRPMDLTRTQLATINKVDYNHWALQHGAVLASRNGGGLIQLALEGDRRTQILILNMTVASSCQAPLSGTLFNESSEGLPSPATLGFNLDSAYPTARQYSQLNGLGENYFLKRSISLNYKKKQVVWVWVQTQRYCTFHLKAHILDGQRTVIETIGDSRTTGVASPPFRITAIIYRGADPNTQAPYPAYRAFYSFYECRDGSMRLTPGTKWPEDC